MKNARTTTWAAAAAGLLLASGPHRPASGQEEAPAVVVYTANSVGSSASVLGGTPLAQVVPDIGVDPGPNAVAATPDGRRVFVATTNSSVAVIDGTSNTLLQHVAFTGTVDVADIAVSRDGARAYAALRGAGGQLGVIDVATLTVVGAFQLPAVGSFPPDPTAIDVSSDGQSVFIVDGTNGSVAKLGSADAALQESRFFFGVREAKVSADGATVVVVGSEAPEFLSAATLDSVATGVAEDRGNHVDLAIAGGRAYLLNESYEPEISDAKAPKDAKAGVGPLPGGPAIDVYDVATGAFVDSHSLPLGDTVRGIDVTADGLTAYVAREGFENLGSVQPVDLTTGAAGASASTGAGPLRVEVVESPPETPVVSYFLPRSVAVKLKGAGKDTLVASGFFDDGASDSVDYAMPVTIEIGGFSRTFTLVPKGAGFKSPKDPQVKFSILPNLKGSSRGKFKMKLAKTTLAGLVDPAAEVPFHFRGAGLPDVEGTVTLTAGRYKLGKARGALVAPPFFPAKAAAKLGAASDSFSFRGGFATDGTTPATLGTVTFRFGPTYSRTIPGGDFVRKGDAFKFKSAAGAAKFAMTIDFLRETVSVAAKGVEVGDLAPPVVDVVFDPGNGAGLIRNTVRIGTAGAKRFY